jgi:preprotein translocase subunit SecG
MYSILVLIASIAAVLLVIVILMQASKGGGLAGTFGGASNMGSMFGTRRTHDQATWWLAGTVAVLAIVANLFFLPGKVTQEQRSIIQESGRQNIPQTPSLPQQLPEQE